MPSTPKRLNRAIQSASSSRIALPKNLYDAVQGCCSWGEIQGNWRNLPEKSKGDLFEELVKAYLQLDPEYASKLKHVWLYGELPQALAKRLRLPATDQGIDIIAETHDGEFWGVQCKYRQETDQSLTWREVATFAGLIGTRRGLTFGLICSTTERITHVLKNQEGIGFCALDVWQSLDTEFFTRLRAHLARKPAALKPLQPRPHQKAAMKDGTAHFVKGNAKRGKLIMPCGSGKSLTAYWMARRLGATRIVIAVPSLALIRQTLKVWLREAMANHQVVNWICVCSDETAGRVERDDMAVLRQDIGVPCLTVPGDIAAWLKRKHRGLTVVFTTYQSGEALSKAARAARFRFDLGIMDEAHKTVGDGGKLFSHLLHDSNLPIARRIFMTATERRYQGQSDSILSMDDPAVYGETFHVLSFKRAMEYDPPILSDYKIISICVSREEIADLIRKNVFVRPDKERWNTEIEADMLASVVALRKAMKKYPIRHAVSFHSSIQRAEWFQAHNDAFTKAFPNYGRLQTYHVSGKTPTGTRARIIGEFAKPRRALITNARCLTEGVDVPGIDCVLFADPRRSKVDIVQAVGRALRPVPGKKLGYVIVPILHEADATPEEIFESGSFQEILTTLAALASSDERIVEYFRAVSQGRKSAGGGNMEFTLDERVARCIDIGQFVREIELRCWNRLAKLSWRPFVEARAFARGLGLLNGADWKEFCKGNLPEKGTLPQDIPACPNETYADKGWIGIGDWLGTGYIALYLRQYRPFEEAREFIHTLGIKSQSEWARFCKGSLPGKGRLPTDIPAAPASGYADIGWVSWGNWLGTGTIAPRLRKYRPFAQARTFSRGLGLKSRTEWKEFCKGGLSGKGARPEDIPANPNRTYAHSGWAGMGDWLGTETIATHFRKYLPYKKARGYVHLLGIKSNLEWRRFCRGDLPEKGTLRQDIPANPNRTYEGKGWAGFGDWLGTGNIAARLRQYRSFKEARAFARGLELRSNMEWRRFCKGNLPTKRCLPKDIPKNPDRTYIGNGWISWGDWLGNFSRQRERAEKSKRRPQNSAKTQRFP